MLEGVTLGNALTIASLVVAVTGAVWALKSDTAILRVRMDSLDDEVKKMSNVLVTLAETNGRMNLLDERHNNTGKRLDDLIRRFNEVLDDKS